MAGLRADDGRDLGVVELATFRCAHCGVFNRVPAYGRARAPVCVACKLRLDISGAPQDVSLEDAQAALRDARGVVIVDLWTGPTRVIDAALERVAALNAGVVLALRLDLTRYPEGRCAFEAARLPCFVAYERGVEVARLDGSVSVQQLERWVELLAGADGAR